MARTSTASHKKTAPTPEATSGRAYALGWRLFLALIALTPLVIGGLPPAFGRLATYHAFDVFSLPKEVTMLVLAGLSLAALCASVIRGGTALRWHGVMWFVVAFLGWATISTILSRSPLVSLWGNYHTFEGLVALVGYALVTFLALQYVRSTRALRAVAVAAVVSGSLVAAYALLQAAGLDPFGWVNETARVFSTLGNADTLGTYLVFPLAFAAGLALSGRPGRTRTAWWACTGLIGVALLATATRGAWIAALSMALCFWLVGWGDRLKVTRGRLVAVSAAALATLAAVSAAIVMVRPRLAASAGTLSALLTSLSNGRTVIWLTGLRGWLASPITGWGPDAFAHAFQSAVGADWYAIIDGLQGAENAHSILVQTLVTVGIPGLILLSWVLWRALSLSLRSVRAVSGSDRLLFVGAWAAVVGMVVALLFGPTTPGVTLWLWLGVGLLLAPLSRPLGPVRPAVPALAAVLGVALAVWAGSWLVADVIVGRAMNLQPGAEQVTELERAVAIDPVTPNYRWLVADAMVADALAQQKAGASAAVVDDEMSRAIETYRVAAAADPGDALVRTAMANVMVAFAARHPGTDAAQEALDVALEAVRLAPGNPAALGALARAYDVSGRHADAVATARLARQIAPAYAAQTLGTLGQ